MDDECLIIKEEYSNYLDFCYDDQISIGFSVYNNSFFNYENLKLIICLNDCVDVLEVSNNLNNEINKNKITTDIACVKPHSKIDYYIRLKYLTFYSGYINIILINSNYCVISKKKICLL